MSQAELADRAGVSQQLISQIEQGKNRTTKELPALARALGRSVFEIDPNFSPDDFAAPDEMTAEMLAIFERLDDPLLRARLLEQARQIDNLAQSLKEPSAPKAEGDQ